MEAKECKIQDILTENKRYVIPAYQRPYSWDGDNAIQLLDDIYQAFSSEEKEYFIGSMICISKGENVFEVVDGQQRLTTLSIIISELKKMLIDYPGVKDDLQKRVLPIDVYSDESSEPRLKVRGREYNLYKFYILQDMKSYKPDKPTDTELLFIENSMSIRGYLSSFNQEELRKLAKYALQNVFVVFVQTDNISSSFRLFNVLNNRGLPLGSADLLKNALFESAAINGKDSGQIESSWSQIEDMVGVSKLDKFLMLHKISEKHDRDRVITRVLELFIDTLDKEFRGDAVSMSLMLVRSAKNYTKIIDNDFDDPKIKRRIASLTHLVTDEWVPPLMAFLNRMDRDDAFSWGDFSLFLEAFEKVYMHGWVKKQVKSQREKVCYSAVAEINNNKTLSDIVISMNLHADNSGFSEALDSDLYEPRPNQVNLIKSILLRVDLESQDESVLKVYSGRITIEHILPQRLDGEYWRKRFSVSEHVAWVHKLGNLTLISGSKNSEAQNSGFDKKKAIYEKLNNKSSFDITKDLCAVSEWDLDALRLRHQSLKKKLQDLWFV